jgi:hypothetical protein
MNKTQPFIASLAILTVLTAVACSDSAASSDDCAGTPWGDGYTLNPGPAIHDGYYSEAECSAICGRTLSTCAPVVEQRTQPQYRCGAPPPAHCGPRHQPRPNVLGPCDTVRGGIDISVSATQLAEPCGVLCGPGFGSVCTKSSTAVEGRHTVRCGDPIPAGCPGAI